jgi:P-type Cu2+ transporter
VPIAVRIGRGTLRKIRQNLGWAVGYKVIALPIAAGVEFHRCRVNALMLKRLKLPAPEAAARSATARASEPTPSPV